MKKLSAAKAGKFGKLFVFGLLFFAFQNLSFDTAFAQTKKPKSTSETTAKTAAANLPKVTQVDLIAFKNLLKRDGAENQKPLLVNFWATWCDPCRAEFPELVKLDEEYKGKIDFITVSLDDLAEIERDVPKFLAEMKAEMPAYLLKTDNEEEAIGAVSKDWQGGLPFTILLNAKGEIAYARQGVVKPEILRVELGKLLGVISQTQILELPRPQVRSFYEGQEDARKDIASGILKIKRYGFTAAIPPAALQKLKKKYGIEVVENGCVLVRVTTDYFTAYNQIMKAEIARKFGEKALKDLGIN